MVSSQNTIIAHLANGSATTFAFDFLVQRSADLQVTLLNADASEATPISYSVTGLGLNTGGTITFVTAPANGLTVVIYRKSFKDQEKDYVPNDDFPAETHETALDRSILLHQEAQRDIGTALRFPVSENVQLSPLTKALRSGKMIEFDSNGNLTFVSRQTIIEAVDSGMLLQAQQARNDAQDAATQSQNSASASLASQIQAGLSSASAAASLAATLAFGVSSFGASSNTLQFKGQSHGPTVTRIATDYSGSSTVTAFGPTNPGGALGTSADILVFNANRLPSGLVSYVDIDANGLGGGSGAFSLVHLSFSGNNVTVLATQAVSVAGAGVKRFVAGTDFPATWDVGGNKIIAIQATAAGGSLRYSNTSTITGYRYYLGVAAGTVATSYTSGGEIYYKVGVATVDYPLLQTVGQIEVSGGTATGVDIACINLQNLPEGVPTKIEVHVQQAGDVGLFYARLNLDGTFDVLDSVTRHCLGGGPQPFYSGGDFPTTWEVGERLFIGVQAINTGAKLRFDQTSGDGYSYFVGTAAGSGVAFDVTYGQRIYYRVTVQNTRRREWKKTASTLLERVTDFGTLPAGWSSTGWNFATGYGENTATGLTNQFRSGKRFGLDRRKIRWEFQLQTSGAVVAFITRPIEGGVNAGSMVRVDATDNALKIFSAYTGSNTPTLIASQACGFALQTARRYILEIEKRGRSFTVRLFDKDGKDSVTFSRTATPWGYTTYPSFGYDQGTLQGAPGVAVITGTARIYNHEHYGLNSQTPRVAIFGDSITEGFGVTDDQKWSRLIENSIGWEDACASGIGGANTAGTLPRLAAELENMRPAYVVVYLGSNAEGAFGANIKRITAGIRAIGAIPVVCTIPTRSGDTTSILSLPSFIQKVEFAKACPTSDTTLFANTDGNGNAYNDNLHPNANGNLAQFNRFSVDSN